MRALVLKNTIYSQWTGSKMTEIVLMRVVEVKNIEVVRKGEIFRPWGK